MTAIRRYAFLKKKEKEIKAELKELKREVLDLVFDEEDEKLETRWGTFSTKNGRANWTYSDALIEKEKKVKQAIALKKREEELKGVAVLESQGTSLVFTMKRA